MIDPCIAYMDNSPSRDTVSGLPERMMSRGLGVERFWAYKSEFPKTLDNYAGVFLGGSPHGAYEDLGFIHAEHDFIQRVADAGLPILGVCFGSQILASALCARQVVFRRSRCHVGFLPIHATEAAQNDALMQGLPAQFRLLTWHNDEVSADHVDITLLATAEDASTQVWRYRDQAIWGIQGHPEVTIQNAVPWLGQVSERLAQDGADADLLADEIDEGRAGTTMIENFLAICRRKLPETRE